MLFARFAPPSLTRDRRCCGSSRKGGANASKTSSRKFATPRWAGYLPSFQKPYAHFSPEEYRDLAGQNGFRVLCMELEDRAWDFQTREAFVAFARASFVEWTCCLPESESSEFIIEVLDRYRTVAADTPQEANTFKFYQLEVVLEPV